MGPDDNTARIVSPTARRLAAIIVAFSAIVQPASADDGVEFFEKKIRPVLIKSCYECHSASSAEVQGGLRLDSRDATRTGGDSGPAVVPSDAANSLLLSAIRHESLEMPPDKKLPDEVIADFERWISMGAPDPRDRPPTAGEAAELSWQATLESRRHWWSLQPVVAHPVPIVQRADWSDEAIDQFILSKLEGSGLAPAALADARTLVRRLSLVLTGLPPEPEEVERFVADAASEPEEAYEALVDRLLESPHFGERWARHWMDVVRFTETHGNEWNYEVHHAWRYRDYLIRAFNQDVPYDQFVREHIAGDLLAEQRWNADEKFNESVIGTGFYRFGEVNHDDCIDLREIGYDLADNRLDTLTKAFQATTVACARCHDHKIDAVSTKDYYALLGILQSTRLVSQTIDAPDVNAEPMRQLAELKGGIRAELGKAWIQDAANVGKYLLAAEAARTGAADAADLATDLDPKRLESWIAALKVENPAIEHPLSPWLTLGSDVASGWREQRDRYAKETTERKQFNAEQFVESSDFRTGSFGDWTPSGQGLRSGPTASGDFSVVADGDRVVGSVLPAGSFTHTLSQKLNGTLRSPILTKGKKHISMQVMGEHTSVVRLVSNNCQLNYRNYKALTKPTLEWFTFEPPEDLDAIRVYAELVTKFDNPKFPDQLGTLGGDVRNDRVPWEEAAKDPRSYFGITRVVLHDCDQAPKAELDHFDPLFAGDDAVQSRAEVASRYTQAIERAISSWNDGKATEADVRWLDWMVGANLLSNSPQQTPELADLTAKYRAIESQQLAVPRIAPGVGDFDDGFDQPLLVRGECRSLGEPVPRRYLEVLADSAEHPWAAHGSGRLALANQIASPANPLTARVMVNRVWHHLFGTGIVGSVDDFGQVGDLPSHPELLDHLATRFVEEGWSVKQLIRNIVCSQTFRMSSHADSVASSIDPDNRLLHHYPARRLDAEAIRDSILAASGRLDRTMFGLSVQPYREQTNSDRRLFAGPLDGNGRRSVYVKVNLMEGPKFLGSFNFPGGKVTQGRRDVTNVPTQALALLNDPFVIQQSAYWGNRVATTSEGSATSRVNDLFAQALGRPLTADEAVEYDQLVSELAELHQVAAAEILKSEPIWKDVAHVVFNLQEFIYIP